MPLVAVFALHLFALLRLQSLRAALCGRPAAHAGGALDRRDQHRQCGRPRRRARASIARSARPASRPRATRRSRGLPAGLIAADIDFGPFLLALTPHSVLAAPYHRLSSGIIAAHEAFARRPDDARRMLARLGVTYVVTCGPRPPERSRRVAAATRASGAGCRPATCRTGSSRSQSHGAVRGLSRAALNASCDAAPRASRWATRTARQSRVRHSAFAGRARGVEVRLALAGVRVLDPLDGRGRRHCIGARLRRHIWMWRRSRRFTGGPDDLLRPSGRLRSRYLPGSYFGATYLHAHFWSLSAAHPAVHLAVRRCCPIWRPTRSGALLGLIAVHVRGRRPAAIERRAPAVRRCSRPLAPSTLII